MNRDLDRQAIEFKSVPWKTIKSVNILEERDHPKLRIRHAPFPVNTKARDRWIPLMEAAIVDSEFAGGGQL